MLTGNDIKFSRIVVDASIVVKWFSDEPDTLLVHQLFQQIYEGKLFAFAPDLLTYEVGNALWKGKDFDRERITASLGALLDSGIEFVRIDDIFIRAAVDLMTKYDLTFYDSTYVALAHVRRAPLLAADAKAYKKISEVKVIGFRKK